MAKEIRNVSASVRARLLQLGKASGQSFDLVLTSFALERLLFRISQSPHAGRFVLKGAMLMMSWFDVPHRGTRDLDLLGFGNPEPDPMLATFREILEHPADDGVTFDAKTLRVDRIREGLEYGGLRVRVVASISGARITLTIDIGFGDALEPGAEMLDYPSMLGFPMPRLRAYARETVIAATFERRETPIPTELDALTDAFAKDEQKQRQWHAFVESVAHDPGDLTGVLTEIATFLIPHAVAAAKLGK